MRKANEEQLSKLEASIRDAEENLGDIEVRDAFLAKADYLYKIGMPCSNPNKYDLPAFSSFPEVECAMK